MYFYNIRYKNDMSREIIFIIFYSSNIPAKNSMLKVSKTYKDKINYYYSFKTQLEGWPRAKRGSLVKARIMSQVDSSQYKNKNGYYHNFKT